MKLVFSYDRRLIKNESVKVNNSSVVLITVSPGKSYIAKKVCYYP